MKKRSLRRPTPTKRSEDLECRAMPAIFVARPEDAEFGLGKYAQAHIRTRSGGYRYLVWREGDQVRELYLGKIRIPALRPQLARGPARRRGPDVGRGRV